MRLPLLSALLASLLLAACTPSDPVVDTPSPSPTPEVSPSATPDPGLTPDPGGPVVSPSPTASPTPFPSGTPLPSVTPRPSASPTPRPSATPGVLATLTLSPANLELDEDGDTGSLSIIARDGNGQTLSTTGMSFTWTSSNSSVATVSSSGTVTAQDDEGTARITVRETRTGISATATVEIDDSSSGGGGGGGSSDDDDDPLENLDADVTGFQGLGAGEFMLNSSDTFLGNSPGSATSPRIAMNADGATAAVWTNNGDIYAQRYFADGTPRGAGFRVNSVTTGTQQAPDVAVLSDGDVAVVWESNSSGNSDIKLRIFQADGSERVSETLVHAADADEQTEPTIAVDGDGDLAIAWTDNNYVSVGDPDNHDVRAIVYRSTGTVSVTEFMVNGATTDDQSAPSIGVSSSGAFAVAWQSGTDGSPTTLDVVARMFEANGDPVANEFTVNDTSADMQGQPALDMNGSGDIVIAWEGNGQSGGNGLDVYAAVYSETGTEVEPEFRVNTSTTDDQYEPSVSLDDDGDFTVAWSGYDTSFDNYSIIARRFDSDGTPTTVELTVNLSLDGNHTSADIAANDDGDYSFAWDGFNASLNTYGILGRRFTADGQAR